MSQFSRGRLEVMKREGIGLVVDGGYDGEGNLTRDPGAILSSRRLLPIGYWKGSAMAVVLDAVAALVSGGRPSHKIGQEGVESAVSQVFIAINIASLLDEREQNDAVNAIVDNLHTATPLPGGENVRYPGERMLRTRQESLEKGVLVDEALFAELISV
jgi:3-dehydro-L-gulonate 2-dehydrogenase